MPRKEVKQQACLGVGKSSQVCETPCDTMSYHEMKCDSTGIDTSTGWDMQQYSAPSAAVYCELVNQLELGILGEEIVGVQSSLWVRWELTLVTSEDVLNALGVIKAHQ